MGKPEEEDDPLEWNPFGAEAGPPQPGTKPAPAAGLRESELFDGTQVGAAPRRRSLQLDFSEVLPAERGGPERIGASTLDMGEFQTRKEREALERAKTLPKADLPSSIDLEERAAGVKVVAENRRIWLWVVLGVLLFVGVVVGSVYGVSTWRQRNLALELEELKKADDIQKKALEEREKALLH